LVNAKVRRLAGLMQVDQEALWSGTDLEAISNTSLTRRCTWNFGG